MKAHFFDIDTLITIDNNVWIVSNKKPSIPIIKVTQSEFNLIKSGIYKKYDSPLNMNDVKYWLPENLLNKLKLKCKKTKTDITDLSFSMQEFLNKEIIKNLDYKILFNHFKHLKNKNDDIYVICSKRSKKNYEPIIEKLEESLKKIGLQVKEYYFISETFYNRNNDDISHKKVRLLLQHLIGLKTSGDRFIEEEIKKYDIIYFYDDNLKSITTAEKADKLFHVLLNNTESYIKEMIREIIKKYDNSLIVRKVTHNNVNIFVDKEVNITYSYIKTTFESFRH